MREINLLPPHRRRTLRREMILLTLSQLLSTLLSALVLVTIGGLTAIVVLWGAGLQAGQSTDVEFQATVLKYRELRDQVSQQNDLLKYVHTLGVERVVWSTLLRELFTVVPPGATISTMSVPFNTDQAEKKYLLSIAGQAQARSTLTIFAERLRGLSQVAQVESPNTNLLIRDNPTYRFVLTIFPNRTE